MTIPAGVLPLSAFTELSGVPLGGPIPILADLMDPTTGDYLSLTKGRSPVDGAIVEGFRVERGSGPAVQNVGHTLREVRHTDASSIAEIQSRVRDGVQHLERAGLARLQKVDVEVTGDLAEVTAWVQDLTLAAQSPEAKPYAVVRGDV